MPRARLARAGDFWTIDFDERTALVPDGKGVRDLAVLLASPRQEIGATDLAAGDRIGTRRPSARELADAGMTASPGAAVERLDPAARRAYHARIAELRALLEDAAAEEETATRAGEELAFLERELRAAEGLGGRVRSAGSAPERARKAVGARLRHALAKIREVHPALGAHLERSLVIGIFCSYVPAEPVEWTVES